MSYITTKWHKKTLEIRGDIYTSDLGPAKIGIQYKWNHQYVNMFGDIFSNKRAVHLEHDRRMGYKSTYVRKTEEAKEEEQRSKELVWQQQY